MNTMLKVGDLVCVCRSSHPLIGKVGRIKHFHKKYDSSDYIGVEFNEPIQGHDLNGHCLSPYGFYMCLDDIKKMEPFTALFKKQWKKEWEPQLLTKKTNENDSTIILEELND